MGNEVGALFQNETLNSESGPYAFFHFRPFTSGKRLVTFKGVTTEYLAGNHVIKVFKQKTKSDPDSPYQRRVCYLANKENAEMYLGKFGRKIITFLELHSAEMDRISMFSRKIRSSDNRHKRRLCTDDVVVFEQDLGKNFETFIERDGTVNASCHSQLEEFVHFVYNESKGQEIVTGLKGVTFNQGQKFKLTSPAMNSIGKKYGPDDIGERAIHNFFTSHVCTHVCSQWPKPTVQHLFPGTVTTYKPKNISTVTKDSETFRDDMPPLYDSQWRIEFEKSLSFSPSVEPSAPPPYDLVT